MLHVCVQRFDVTINLEKFCKILGTKNYLVSSDPVEKTATLTSSKMVRQRLLTSCSLVQQSGREPDRSSAVERPETCVKQARKTRRGPERGVGAQAQRMCVRRRGSCAESKAPDGTRALRSVSFVGGPRRNRRHESGGCSGHAPAAARLVFVPETSAGALRSVVLRSKHPCPRLLGVSAASPKSLCVKRLGEPAVHTRERALALSRKRSDMHAPS